MKLKNLGTLFLLSLASIYFVCPVQCAAIAEPGRTLHLIRFRVITHIGLAHKPLVKRTRRLAVGLKMNHPLPKKAKRRKDIVASASGNRLEQVNPKLALQIQKDTFLLVVLIPATPRFFSDSVFYATYFQLPYKPYTDPSLPQLSPRAPPLFLA